MSRWTVGSLEEAQARCRKRTVEGIGCILHLLDEYTRTEEQAERRATGYLSLLRDMESGTGSTAISVKISSLSALVSTPRILRRVQDLAHAAAEHRVGFEIDMEGPGLVDRAIQAAITCRDEDLPVTLALQAYLDRSQEDLSRLLSAGITPRLVKGAYAGDTSEFEEIEDRFRYLARRILDTGIPFHVGTHDPVLLSWLRAVPGIRKEQVQFGFLLGLSGTTLHAMAEEGWVVAEYIPLGTEGGAYLARRERYLRDLHRLGRAPAP